MVVAELMSQSRPVTVALLIFRIVTMSGIFLSPGAASISVVVLPHAVFTTLNQMGSKGKYGGP